jgi:mannose/fructose/N-acetylgalactosamine-specific phosphotransferase system component IID
MKGGLRALLRLFYVQAAWNYERMLGIGMGHAAGPLLEDLRAVDPARHAEAVARSSDYFNANPNLAGLALGALTRAEHDHVPGAAVSRLRMALSGPLGALGDRLFWAGVVPALSALALAAIALGAGWRAALALVLVYGVIRALTARWALSTGWAEGLQVGAAIGRSWVPRSAERAGVVAGFCVGLAIPLAATWLLRGVGREPALVALAVALAGLALSRLAGPHHTALRFGVGMLMLGLLAGVLGA